MSIFLCGIFTGNTAYYNRGEWILVFETNIVITNHRKRRQKIVTIDTNNVLLSFYRGREHTMTVSNFSIARENFDFPFCTRADTNIVVILACHEINLFESIDEFCAQYRCSRLVFCWKKGSIVRKFSRQQARGEANGSNLYEHLRLVSKDFNGFDVFGNEA